MSAPLLGREQILAVLRDLAEELARQGVRAEVFLVGGAAMTLAYDTRRATRDVDGIFEPKQTVYAAARRVADDHGLPEDRAGDALEALRLIARAPRRAGRPGFVGIANIGETDLGRRAKAVLRAELSEPEAA